MSGPLPGWSERPPDRSQRELQPAVPPGRLAMVLAAVAIGVLLLGVQLWFLTVALDLFLAGETGADLWVLAGLSGVVFAGGLLALRLLPRTPRIRG